MSTFGTTAAAPAAAGGWAIALRRCRAQRVGITSSAAASSSGRGATEGEEEAVGGWWLPKYAGQDFGPEQAWEGLSAPLAGYLLSFGPGIPDFHIAGTWHR